MEAILTHYLGPTNTKPGRIKAQAGRNSVTISYSHESTDDRGPRAHCPRTARALCNKLGWKGELAGGGLIKRATLLILLASPAAAQQMTTCQSDTRGGQICFTTPADPPQPQFYGGRGLPRSDALDDSWQTRRRRSDGDE